MDIPVMISAAIVGLGRWGQALVSSVQGISGEIRFTHAVTRSPDKCNEFLRRHAIPVTDFDAVLADRSIDAVVLATPHALHAEQIMAVARAGKHVFVEKPFTLTKVSAVSALSECRGANVTVGIGLNRRFLPAYAAMKEVVHGQKLGALMHVEGVFASNIVGDVGTWRRFATESPAGSMTSLGIHVLDLMIDLASDVSEVTAISQRRAIAWDIDDTTVVICRHQSGVSGYLCTLAQGAHLFMLRAYCAHGWVELRGDRTLVTCVAPARGMGGAESVQTFDMFDTLHAELECFSRSVCNAEPFPVSDAQVINGVATLEAIAVAGKQPHLAVKVGGSMDYPIPVVI
jgi:predicted dehydrogenase